MLKTRSWKKRILCLALSLICFVSALPAAEVSAEAAQTQGTVYTSLIYRNASSRGTPIGRMEEGTVVRVLEQRGEYYKIDCYDSVGYIAVSQVKQRENGEYYICCEEGSSHTALMETRSVSDALLLRATLMQVAQDQLGDPYVYGGTGPNGFDCSGFAKFVYGNNGYALTRTCTSQMSQSLIVSREGLQIGDLIFFGSSLGDVGHVGIYAGDGQIIHASSSMGISYADLDTAWFAQSYLCARRVVTVGTQLTQVTPAAAADNLLTRTADTTIRSVR